MGIKNFYKHFKKKFTSSILSECPISHDILILELNGIFYECTRRYILQKMIQRNKPQILHIELFHMIGEEIFEILENLLPNEKVFLVVDGFAPMMKFKEQYQRRHKNIIYNQYDGLFDLNQYTPGTKFMDFLTKYIDWIIKKKMNENIDKYKNIHIYFSNEKNRGEGEFKAMNFIRKTENHNKSICIYSNDSDWIHLSLLLSTSLNDIYICRNKYQNYEYIDVNNFKNNLKIFFFDEKDTISFIDIFILWLFLGNDYIDSMDYLDNLDIIYDTILPLYQKTKLHFIDSSYKININNYLKFLKLCISEIPILNLIPKKDIDVNDYRNTYYHFHTIQNLLNMTHQIDFDWNFINFHSITNISIFHQIDLSVISQQNLTHPLSKTDPVNECYFHLMILLPKESEHYLPKCLHNSPKLDNNNITYCRIKNKFKFQFTASTFPILTQFYIQKKNLLSCEEKKRNLEGKIFKYKYNIRKSTFLKGFYGTIRTNKIEVSTMNSS